jgi:hypothetical protein
MPNDDGSHEKTDDPLHADRRNFYKVEKWSRNGQRINEMLFAGTSGAKAQRVFEWLVRKRPRSKLTISQRKSSVAGVSSHQTGLTLTSFLTYRAFLV